MIESVNLIKEKLKHNFIHISRIPNKTYNQFMEFASEDEFCKDYGMALKFLLDFYFGVIPTGIEHLEQEIIILKQEIEALKQVPEEKPVRKRLDGRVIKNE